MTDVAVLIATKDRTSLLAERALPSVVQQTRAPSVVVLVNDGSAVSRAARSHLRALGAGAGVDIVLVPNGRTPGAGGAWNTGLEYLYGQGARGFVAILDDDDAWDPEHVEANLALPDDANIRLSGLRMQMKGRVIERPLIDHLEPRAFLVGNPGWQGSNTFVDLGLLMRVGGFREGLASLNDRDLAFRLLSHPAAAWRLTDRWTATWYADTRCNLSEPRSQSKLDGLRAFWALYGRQMNSMEARRFFDRARRLFGVDPAAVSNSPPTMLPSLGFAGVTCDG